MSKPFCAALILADHVHCNGRGEWTILNTFNSTYCDRFPAPYDFGVYFVISNMRGKVPIRLRIVNADQVDEPEARSVAEITMDVVNDNPLEDFYWGANLHTVVPDEGRYLVELWADKELIMSRRLYILHAPGNEPSI